MTRLNAEIEDDTYEKWAQHARDGDKYANLSHLVRVAVANQIEYDNEFDKPFNAIHKSESGVTDEIEDLKEDLNRTLISLQNDINQIQVESEGTSNENLLSNLMSEFHDIVPRKSKQEVESGNVVETRVDEIINDAKSKGKISRDIKDIDARKALTKLAEDIPTVESYVDEETGERHFYEKR